MSTRSFATEHTERNPLLPQLLGSHGAIACEHYLAAQAGRDILEAGGNAIDAAVAATLVEGLCNPQMHTFGGECPMLICAAGEPRVVAVNGNTAAPMLATPEAYRARGLEEVPEEGILAAGVPAAPAALLDALTQFGSLDLATVSAPALRLAREGFPVHRGLVGQPRYGLADLGAKFRAEWPASAALYLPGGEVPEVGHLLANPALAQLIEHLLEAERRRGGTREMGIAAARDAFYRGDPASAIEAFSLEREGLLRRADLEAFCTRFEPPAALDFRGLRIFKCGLWNQGPVMLQALAILDRFPIEDLRPDGPEYLHLLVEAMKLAFADREQYYGDPDWIRTRLGPLLAPEYSRARAALIDPGRADPELRPGDPASGAALLAVEERLGGAAWGAGTVHVDCVDAAGNLASFTPSGGWLRSNEVVPELGFPLGNRLMTFYLAPEHHPNVLGPRKRPRTTISPSLALREGRPWAAFGSMGGDQQDQWQLQYLLNRAVFGMSLQGAIEAPKLSSEHFPGFFAPHERTPLRVRIEPRFPAETLGALEALGHDLEVAPDWTEGYLLAVERHPGGVLEAGCDPRGTKGDVFPAFALAW